MFEREKSEKVKLPEWTRGRAVIIRPDVPGKRFHPEHTIVLTTPGRRAAAELAIKAFYNELEEQGDNRPTWAPREAAESAEVEAGSVDAPDENK
jgi:hypothetical protein